MRRSSFESIGDSQSIDVSISREVQTQYDDIKVVADNIDTVVQIGDLDTSGKLDDVIAVGDVVDKVINMTAVTGPAGSEASWDGVLGVLTVPRGDKGETGDVGPQGIQGEKGDTGDQGIQGVQGETGPIGLTGAQGIQGETGLQGETGPAGEKGDTGDQGIQGIQGIKGDTGDQGLTGKGIDTVVSSKAEGTTTVTVTGTFDNSPEIFLIQDGVDGEGAGDMLKATYDSTDNGVVDNAELVNNLTVETAVPAGAVFTDTVYDDTVIQAEVATKADIVHTHVETDITDLDKYTQLEVDTALGLKADQANPSFTGSITEQVAVMSGSAIDATLGTIQTKTLTEDTTFTDSLTDGQSVVLHVTNSGYTITYPTITWIGGDAPELGTVDGIVFYKIGATLYGAFIGTVGA